MSTKPKPAVPSVSEACDDLKRVTRDMFVFVVGGKGDPWAKLRVANVIWALKRAIAAVKALK
jgi:hypothetical protein